MLDDDHRGDVGGQPLHDRQGGLGAAGGGAQADDNPVQIGTGSQAGGGAHVDSPGLGDGGGSAGPGRGGHDHLLGQSGQESLGALVVVGLADKVHRAHGQGVKYL